VSKEAQSIEAARRAYVAAMGTKNEQLMRAALERAVAAARKASA
jgi:hypothetical protein